MGRTGKLRPPKGPTSTPRPESTGMLWPERSSWTEEKGNMCLSSGLHSPLPAVTSEHFEASWSSWKCQWVAICGSSGPHSPSSTCCHLCMLRNLSEHSDVAAAKTAKAHTHPHPLSWLWALEHMESMVTKQGRVRLGLSGLAFPSLMGPPSWRIWTWELHILLLELQAHTPNWAQGLKRAQNQS